MTVVEGRGQRFSGIVECAVVVVAAVAAAALLRQVPSAPIRSPDVLVWWWLLNMKGPGLPQVMLTVGYLMGVGLLAGLVVSVRSTGIDRGVAKRVARCGAITATMAATIPSIDSVTVAMLGLPGIPIALGIVYAVARGSAWVAARLRSPGSARLRLIMLGVLLGLTVIGAAWLAQNRFHGGSLPQDDRGMTAIVRPFALGRYIRRGASAIPARETR